VGAHESGKTTVAVQIIEALVKQGLKVGSLKHTDREYETDVEGKDSQRHKAAGANPAVLVAGGRSAVHRQAPERPALSDFLEGEFGLRECDVVIVEGYRSEAYPKIEVCRAATGRNPLCEADSSVVAVVTDRPTAHASSVPRFTFEEIPSLLLFLRKSPVFSSL
jgi:molybdopterin-guanine dinucleotide biosynthesis protein MobB